MKVKRPVQGNLALPRVCAAYFQMSDGVRVPDQCAAVRPLDMCGPYATEEPSIYGSYRVCQTVNSKACRWKGRELLVAFRVVEWQAAQQPLAD